MTVARRSFRFLVALAAAAVAGCHIEEPFARDNHWDADSEATKTLLAPDSTHSVGETFRVTILADPPLPAGRGVITWESIGATDPVTQVFASGDGEFIVAKATASYKSVPVWARFDALLVVAHVMVGQSVATFDLFCGSAATPVACDAVPMAVGAQRTVNSTMADANTNAISGRDVVMQRASTVSRDPSVLSTAPTAANPSGAWTVRGVAAGATWLVVTADGVRDSVRFVVGP